MNSKRSFPSEEESSEGSLVHCRPKKLRRLFRIVQLLRTKQTMQGLWVEMEQLFRRVVQEELQKVLVHIMHPEPRQGIGRRHEVQYRIHFRERLSDDIYTEKKFSVPIVMLESNSNEVVTSGPLSSIKIEVVVVHGHFGGDGREEWTEEEFNQHVQTQRDGRRPLLTGRLVIKLCNGAGTFVGMAFTDNSSWTRSGMFRLGARIFHGESFEERVQEAISEAFPVKDSRVESCQKHYPPLLGDEIWRLQNIWKDGKYCERLEHLGIRTVQDFLHRLKMGEEDLRRNLGRMPRKDWEATVRHANESVPGDKLYSYRNAEQRVDLIFGSDFQLFGAKFEGRYHPLNGLNASQKDIVEDLEKHAYEHRNDIFLLRHTMSCSIPGLLPTADGALTIGSSSHQQQNTIPPPIYHDEAATQEGLNYQQSTQHIVTRGDIYQPNELSSWEDTFKVGRKNREVIVGHARECVPGEPRVEPIFGPDICLDASQKDKGKDLERHADEHQNDIVLSQEIMYCNLRTADAFQIIGSSSHQPQNTIPLPIYHDVTQDNLQYQHSAQHIETIGYTFQPNDLTGEDLFNEIFNEGYEQGWHMQQ